jgi:hypothetical protein
MARKRQQSNLLDMRPRRLCDHVPRPAAASGSDAAQGAAQAAGADGARGPESDAAEPVGHQGGGPGGAGRSPAVAPDAMQCVSIQIPRFRSRWMGWLQCRLRRPYLQLHLDPIGTTVWLACDGEHSVADIGALLRDRFGPDIEPVWERLALFVRHLARGRLIALEAPEDQPPTS